MSKRTNPLRFNLINAYCFIVVDACILLHYIFGEEEFKPKIEFLINVCKSEKILPEILPQTIYEVNKRTTEAAKEFSEVLSNCQQHIQRISKKPLSQLKIDRNSANIIRTAFAKAFEDISRKSFRRYEHKIEKIRKARIIETAIMWDFWDSFGDTALNVEQFFKNIRDKFGQIYKEFCSKQATFMKEMNMAAIDKSRIPETTKELDDMFYKRCRIKNLGDLRLLCEAVSRMYDVDKWCGVLTTDYGDIVQNETQIDRLTLLTVCDPLYFPYHLDSKLDLGLRPKTVAARFGIRFAEFFKSRVPVGVI